MPKNIISPSGILALQGGEDVKAVPGSGTVHYADGTTVIDSVTGNPIIW